jgi:hypothetical protein
MKVKKKEGEEDGKKKDELQVDTQALESFEGQ